MDEGDSAISSSTAFPQLMVQLVCGLDHFFLYIRFGLQQDAGEPDDDVSLENGWRVWRKDGFNGCRATGTADGRAAGRRRRMLTPLHSFAARNGQHAYRCSCGALSPPPTNASYPPVHFEAP